jgi:hypothetical protein
VARYPAAVWVWEIDRSRRLVGAVRVVPVKTNILVRENRPAIVIAGAFLGTWTKGIRRSPLLAGIFVGVRLPHKAHVDR